MDKSKISFLVMRKLCTMTVPSRQNLLSEKAEIYKDLGIYGDDLYELSVWISDQFGVDLNFSAMNIAPGEQPFLWISRILHKYLKLNYRNYSSFTAERLIDIIFEHQNN